MTSADARQSRPPDPAELLLSRPYVRGSADIPLLMPRFTPRQGPVPRFTPRTVSAAIPPQSPSAAAQPAAQPAALPAPRPAAAAPGAARHAGRLSSSPARRRDKSVRAAIGDQIRIPIMWCQFGSCIARYTHHAALGEQDLRARALKTGWRYDALGRLACPDCAQHDPAFWITNPPATVARPRTGPDTLPDR